MHLFFLPEYSLILTLESDLNTVDEVFSKPVAPPPPPKQAIATSLHINFEEDAGDDDTLLNQYMMENHESTRLSQVAQPPVNNDEITLQLQGKHFLNCTVFLD